MTHREAIHDQHHDCQQDKVRCLGRSFVQAS
jgi:hypothetical protein